MYGRAGDQANCAYTRIGAADLPRWTHFSASTDPSHDPAREGVSLQAGQRIILDADLAALYGVTTKRLNEQVKRNINQFPEDFLFRLTVTEATALRSQFATSKNTPEDGRGGTRYQPFAFTEHGAIQAANVLDSPRAVKMGLHVVRAFVQLRALLAAIPSAIRELMHPPASRRRGIGFTADLGQPK